MRLKCNLVLAGNLKKKKEKVKFRAAPKGVDFDLIAKADSSSRDEESQETNKHLCLRSDSRVKLFHYNRYTLHVTLLRSAVCEVASHPDNITDQHLKSPARRCESAIHIYSCV